jgi:uncharacterized membrane protein
MNIEELEFRIAKFLRSGVIVAAVIIAVGWILTFKAEPEPFSSLKTYQQIDVFTQMELAFMDQNLGRLISYLGLIVLISLPVIRVIFSTFLFIKQKEFIMATIGSIVLLGLCLSFSFGIEL